MNLIGFIFRWIAEILCRTRFRRLVINNAYAKFLIIVGGLKWHDLPHLHHPLIHLRMDLEYRRDLPRLKEVKNELSKDFDFTKHTNGSITMMRNPESTKKLMEWDWGVSDIATKEDQ